MSNTQHKASHSSDPAANQWLDPQFLDQLQKSVKETVNKMNDSIATAQKHRQTLQQKVINHEDVNIVHQALERGDIPRAIEEAIRQHKDHLGTQFQTQVDRDIARSIGHPHRRQRGIPA